MAANGSEKAFCVLTFHACRLVNLSSSNSAPNSVKNHHLTIPFEGGTHSFKRQGACVKETITADMLQTVWNELDYRVVFVESQKVHVYSTSKVYNKLGVLFY